MRKILIFGMVLSIGTRAQQWLDPSFGDAGLSLTWLSQYFDGANRVAVQSDGKLVVMGSIVNQLGSRDLMVARFLPEGDLDPSFGINGLVTHDGAPDDLGRDLALQVDGGVVVVGIASVPGVSMAGEVVRFTAEGTLDPAFGNGGEVIIDNGYNGFLTGVAVQDDGKIVVVGKGSDDGVLEKFYLARLNTDGTMDGGFGMEGEVFTSVSSGDVGANEVVLLDDGRMISVGRSGDGQAGECDVTVIRYLEDGALDVTFDEDGIAVLPSIGVTDAGNAVTVQPDGKVVVAGGGAQSTDSACVFVARLLPDGSLDPWFGEDGIVRTRTGYLHTGASGVVLDGINRILLVGSVAPSFEHFDSYLCRLLPDGTLDAAFGTGGELVHSFMGLSEQTQGIALRADGRIILAGMIGLTPNGTNTLLLGYLDAPVGMNNIPAQEMYGVHSDGGDVEFGCPSGSALAYSIRDLAGRVLQEGEVKDPWSSYHRITLTPHLLDGIYVLSLRRGSERMAGTFFVHGR